MRYTLEMELDQTRERVVELFLDHKNLFEWQEGIVDFEPLGDGDPRGVGARNRQVHRMGKREIEMVETITVANAPREFAATYEADGVWNLIENEFDELSDGRTKWTLHSEFKCTGMMRIMAFLMPGMFKKQTLAFMKMFKAFVEKN